MADPIPTSDALAFFLHRGQTRDHETLVMMVFLADWKTCLEGNPQLLDVHWVLSSQGPSALAVHETLDTDPRFEHLRDNTIRLCGPAPVIPPEVRQYLEHVEKTTKDLRRDKLTQLVYSVYPVMHTDRFAPIDLVRCAAYYREFRERHKSSEA